MSSPKAEAKPIVWIGTALIIMAGCILSGVPGVFGLLFLLAAFSAEAADPGGRLLVGAILLVVALGVLAAAGVGVFLLLRWQRPRPRIEIEQKIDIGGDVEMEALKCESCGAQLDKSAISLAEGAVVVTCPYCSATYQIVEEPKW
jgi:DNA-directed RNA polymerase subunit RPC12/RpoP